MDMNTIIFLVVAAVFYFIFEGPHTKKMKKPDDKKGGDKGGKK